MTNEELKALLFTPEDKGDNVQEVIIDPLTSASEKVMEAYQNANKWLDIIKEFVLLDLGCVFFSNYIHRLAHTMPERFDKFGDILHTMNMRVPYPATPYIEVIPSDIPSVFNQIFNILECICGSLREFIKVTQDTPAHAAASKADELLVDISGEFTHLYRMRKAYSSSCEESLKFDQWVAVYLNNLDTLID